MILGVYIRTNNIAMIIQKIKYGTQKRHTFHKEKIWIFRSTKSIEISPIADSEFASLLLKITVN